MIAFAISKTKENIIFMEANVETNKTNTATKFNKNVPQTIKFRKSDDEYSYVLDFKINNLDDSDLAEVDRLSNIKLEASEDGQKMTVENLEASEWFFDKNVKLVGDGYEGELPENWQSEFTPVEKQAVVSDFLFVEVWKPSKTKVTKKFSFGGIKQRKITLKVIFDGKEMLVNHELPVNINTFTTRFREITSGLESKQGQTGSFLPETQEQLAELYDDAKVTFSADDYDSEPPSHHKATVMREAFGLQVHSQTKKLKV